MFSQSQARLLHYPHRILTLHTNWGYTEVACPVTGRAQHELTPTKIPKTGPGLEWLHVFDDVPNKHHSPRHRSCSSSPWRSWSSTWRHRQMSRRPAGTGMMERWRQPGTLRDVTWPSWCFPQSTATPTVCSTFVHAKNNRNIMKLLMKRFHAITS